METASFSLSAIMVGWLGSAELASYQIMIAVSQICFMMYYGMGAAVSVRISNFLGQRDIVNVRRTANIGFHIILIMIVCTSIPIYLLRNHLGGWFTDDATVAAMVAQVIDSVPSLPVWRRTANQFCQFLERHCRCTPDDVVLIYCLFHYITSFGILVRLCFRLENHRYMDGFPVRLDQCRNYVLSQIQI